ncbi:MULTISPECIES: nicotinate-nucleotide adenylyltransferase [Nitrosomonas]|uniref:Probable nicotinate-nucleotide adenylyltransferase n=3 Tax=Nitrosomonas eutropha TaxID=916 RepID=A0ABX5M9M3_9PROT|nr:MULTISPECIES: nicotinate-nucleotide adenylyltransferase [Nitrosomonas]ABI59853.1 nicotinate-nucleotide adenylyltransferase [Nitrosomonas eutropha C91]MXS80351.1 nicotinate-nucleotide adenylyltransferase [Nitrosomonas sp. GH22]PXV83556.1 nicotinate-nucleotide adenylyltransferase [Nitrosomonas eutropha]SCW99654.1 nicotinate-nucleotide adenylyltransferase [Nitrosomonas eutropha]SDW29477.1 nicotinate-nucleotide adenylyltransferase [Nitrosomonas eutropha]
MAEVTAYSLIGIYGGTFDPVHYGHLRIAEELTGILRLSHLFFLPAGQPRLRDTPIVPGAHRVAMLHEAIRGNAMFSVDDREIKRSGETYSVESLQEIRQEYQAKYKAGKHIALCFIIGADAFIRLPHWHRWRELFELCHLIIVNRPGSALLNNLSDLPDELKAACQTHQAVTVEELKNLPCGHIFTTPTTLLDISSTKIRSLIASGKSARYLLPEAVLDYIDKHNFYAGEK